MGAALFVQRKSGIRIRRGNMKFEKRVVGKVIGLGIAPFIMQSTESLVNITLNAGLQRYGGDLYVGSMTIMQSVMHDARSCPSRASHRARSLL